MKDMSVSDFLGAAATLAAVAQLEKERDEIDRKLHILRTKGVPAPVAENGAGIRRPGAKRAAAGRVAKKRRYRGPVNMTAQVLRIVTSAKRPLAVQEVRKQCNGRRMTKAARASVHSALLRLAKTGQIKVIGEGRHHMYGPVKAQEVA